MLLKEHMGLFDSATTREVTAMKISTVTGQVADKGRIMDSMKTEIQIRQTWLECPPFKDRHAICTVRM
jgi:hypothetical protein